MGIQGVQFLPAELVTGRDAVGGPVQDGQGCPRQPGRAQMRARTVSAAAWESRRPRGLPMLTASSTWPPDAGRLGATAGAVLSLVGRAEFKRKQAAPGLKVTDRAFGTGWRMPIAARTEAVE